MTTSPYLIIGNSAAAVGAVEGMRSVDAEKPITLIASEPHHTYSRPLISYLLGGEVDEDRMPYRPADFYDKNRVRAMLGREVTAVDPDAHMVETSDGERLRYEKLLIATGGVPIVPRDVAGVEAEGVFSFTTWDDARRILAFIKQHDVTVGVVVGGGLIGLKSMEALVNLGIRTTLVELADRVLSVTFDGTASALARTRLEESGVDVRCGTTVARVLAQDSKVSGVVLRDGSEVSCGMVIFAIGVIPNTGLVRGTAVEVDRGIVVDDSMRSSAPDVYAAGDVAQATSLLGGAKRPIPILPNAYRQGLIAGANMAGRDRIYRGGLAMNAVDIFGLATISVGRTMADGEGGEVLGHLNEERGRYKKIVLENDRVIGAIFMGDIDRAGIITGLLRERINVANLKDLLLTDDFGIISLPAEYRKHVVSGLAIEV